MSDKKTIPNASIGSSAENSYKKTETTRRGFLSWLTVGWAAYIGVTGGFSQLSYVFFFRMFYLNHLKLLKLDILKIFRQIVLI